MNTEVDDQSEPLLLTSEPAHSGVGWGPGATAPLAVQRIRRLEVAALRLPAEGPADTGRRPAARLEQGEIAGRQIGRLALACRRELAQAVCIDEHRAHPMPAHLVGEDFEGLRLVRHRDDEQEVGAEATHERLIAVIVGDYGIST